MMTHDAKNPHLITQYGGQGARGGASTYSKNIHKVVVIVATGKTAAKRRCRENVTIAVIYPCQGQEMVDCLDKNVPKRPRKTKQKSLID
jgi:hypothetical protein